MFGRKKNKLLLLVDLPEEGTELAFLNYSLCQRPGLHYPCLALGAELGITTSFVYLSMSFLHDDSTQPGGSRENGEFVGTYELA